MPRVAFPAKLVASSLALFAGLACPLAHAVVSEEAATPTVVIQPNVLRLSPAGASLGRALFTLAHEAWTDATNATGPIRVEGLRTDDGRLLDLRLVRRDAVPATITLSSENGDAPFAFDVSRVQRLSGPVEGYPGSWAVIIAFDGEALGQVMLAPGAALRPFRIRIGEGSADAATMFDRPISVPTNDDFPCVMDGDPTLGAMDALESPLAPPVTDLDGPVKGMRRARLALKVDNEFYKYYNDATKAAAYLTLNFALVSDLFERDIRVRVDLVHVSIDTTGTGVPPIPVPFDLVQNVFGKQTGGTGNASLPGDSSNVDGLQGVLTSIYEVDHITRVDPHVTAHEIGHNFGTAHDCDYQIDQCCNAQGLPRRASLMSYCSQAWSGGEANGGLFFHTKSREEMLKQFNNANGFWKNKAIYDCNQNNIADATDIASGTSKDLNANTIPDECEDCNKNGILDTIDISGGLSTDLNNNTIPDECEPDANNNNVPDDLDIKAGTSKDDWGNGIPDEAEPDCNNNGTSDISEIYLNMPLDIDRNEVLDACQDCNANGKPDLADFKHSHNFFAASGGAGRVQEHHGGTGVLMTKTADNSVPSPTDLIITPDRRILIASGTEHRVVAFTQDLAPLGNLVVPGAGGLSNPGGLLISPAGDLLVSSTSNDRILRYNLATGAFLGIFVAPGSGGLDAPLGMAIGPSNGLFVCGAPGRVFEFDATTGGFRRIFIDTPGNGGIVTPRSLVFQDDPARCLVVGDTANQIFSYNAISGTFIGLFNPGYAPGKMPKLNDITIGHNGDVFVSHNQPAQKPGGEVGLNHLTSPRVSQFDGKTGLYRRAFVMAADSQLSAPTGIAFMPDIGVDCNKNLRLDSCDIALGYSQDQNNNGVPDECESQPCYPDCDTVNGLSIDDFICFQTLFAINNNYADCDADGTLTIDDFICFQTFFALGC